MTTKRYESIKGYPGIRKDLKTQKFQARKKIDGIAYSEVFDKVSEAIHWKKTFHPMLSSTKIESINANQYLTQRPNGVDGRFTFKQVWELYCEQHLPSIEPQSAEYTKKRASYLFPDFYNFRMQQISAELIDIILKKKVAEYKASSAKAKRRLNFNRELKKLKALLNWYRENYDAMFVVPVLKRHFTIGTAVNKRSSKKKKMDMKEVQLFFESIDSQFWKDFAEFHFFMAGRVQEPAGLQVESVSVKTRCISVCDVVVWDSSKKFAYLKETPKNGHERKVYLNDRMLEIYERRLSLLSEKKCKFFRESDGSRLNFLFNIDGQPLGYRQIQYRYNKALKKAGLYPTFSATHILRKAMANIVRQNMGLDAAQAVGGWKSREVVEKVYTDEAPAELNKLAVNTVASLLKRDDNKPKAGTKLRLIKD